MRITSLYEHLRTRASPSQSPALWAPEDMRWPALGTPQWAPEDIRWPLRSRPSAGLGPRPSAGLGPWWNWRRPCAHW
eukprot:scaffold70292_cov65-Phaeocystis_antarctica.AAC.2